MVEVIFATKQLRRSYQGSDRALRKWGNDVGRKYITRIAQLYAVRDFEAAFSIRSLRLHPLKGKRRGEFAIHLTGRWRLVVTKGDGEEQVIVKRVSNHYDD